MKNKFLNILKKYSCTLVEYKYFRSQPDWCNYDIWFTNKEGKKFYFEGWYDVYHKIDTIYHSYLINGVKTCVTSKEGILIDFEQFVLKSLV